MNSNNITKPKDIIIIFAVIIGGGLLIGRLLYAVSIINPSLNEKMNLECDELVKKYPQVSVQSLPARCIYHFYHNMDTGNSLLFSTK